MSVRAIITAGRNCWARPASLSAGIALLLVFCFALAGAQAAEVIPPAPRNHFNDYAGVVQSATARQLETELTQFERDTSNQILVVIYPHMQSDSSIEDYTVRVFEAWKVGGNKLSNGAVLFVFSQDRRMRIATGYGLEAALPDALAKQILENELTPRFRNGDFSGGVAAGVHAMMAATRGEYRGTGRTVADAHSRGSGIGFNAVLSILLILLIAVARIFSRRNVLYTRRGRISPWISTGGWGGGGGGWSSGGGGGGSFSGGGGHTGGGGASGSW